MRTAPKRSNGKNGAKVECTLIRVLPPGGGDKGRILTSICVETRDAKKIYDAVDLLELEGFQAQQRWTTASGEVRGGPLESFAPFIMACCREFLNPHCSRGRVRITTITACCLVLLDPHTLRGRVFFTTVC